MPVERYTVTELIKLIEDGKNYRLLRPYFFKGQVLINVEKILTVKDLEKLQDKLFAPIEVVPAVVHNADDSVRKAIITNAIKILKTSSTFRLDDKHHLDFEKRKECEKILTGVINGNPHLANLLLKIYKHSKKLFVHSINVGIIATIIDLGIQQKQKHHDGLRCEVLLTSALLHDVGFLKLPLSMVEKRRVEYDDNEKELYLKYPSLSKEVVQKLGDNIRNRSIDIIFQHQERLLGNGFPHRLKGKAIDELALIIGLSDEFDLLCTNEISTTQKSISEIMSRISRSGKIFGMHIVDSFYTWFRYLK